jgi:putative SOS response-associated peptidase YedK
MCGRFVLLTDLSVITASFNVQEVACEYRPGRGISPGQEVAAVIRDDQNRLVGFRWGLIPSWARDPAVGMRLFNARAETLPEKPSFKNAFKKRRCLIIADGFYEWRKQGKMKQPLYFKLKSGRPFGFAGLHESWVSPGHQSFRTCTIITTAPNELIKPIHDRMPAIVPKEHETFWLDPGNRNQKDLLSLLRPYPAEEMDMSDEKTPD